MPKIPWRLAALVQTLTDETVLAEALLFPKLSILHENVEKLRAVLAARVQRQIKELKTADVYRHRLGELPAVKQLEIEIPPLKGDPLRTSPVSLTLHFVQWNHARDAVIAYFPALQMEILAADDEELAEQLLPQVRSALSRQKTAAKLRNLVLLERRRSLQVRPLRLKVKLPTLKQAGQQEAKEAQESQRSVLKQIGIRLTKNDPRAPLEPTYERAAELQRLEEYLTSPLPRSVLLVGKSGVGKTALVRELARLGQHSGLGEMPLWSTSGSRIVAGMCGFGMWQERCQQLVHEAAKTKSVVHLDHLVELIEVGKGGGNPQGIASFLCPAIARGSLLAIAECTPQQLATIEKEHPQLLEAFVQLEIAESTPEQTRSILAKVAARGDDSASDVIDDDALGVIDRLHRRYAAYSASPGRPLRFLRNLLADRDPRQAITASAATGAFSHETGLPLFMLDDRVPLDVETTRQWFQQRVIGQPQPVDLVVDLIASVKAGLARGGKPIASLLFIGPTGVGKTEMARSLAEFLYQDPGRMIRFDMSEYAHPQAIERLIGGSLTTQGLLTQKVRDQPFMVVLLDEFEKAHPLFYDVLLQVLGEGRLTDGAGRMAEFTSTVVIMTSNLGAESFRHANVGFGGEAALEQQAERHFEQEVKAFLRPEMFNRIDRIVPFAPLDQGTITSIARRELDRFTQRDGIRLRGVNLEIGDDVVEQLARTGYDSRYGARPLKRAIERELVAPLAEKLNRYAADVVIDSHVAARDGRLTIETSARPVPVPGGGVAEASVFTALEAVVALRRKLQALQNSGVILQARNEIQRVRQAQRQERKRAKKRGTQPQFTFTAAQARALKQQELLQRMDQLAASAVALEDRSLLEFYAGRTLQTAEIETARSGLTQEFNTLLSDVFQQQSGRPKLITLIISGEHFEHVCELAIAYDRICRHFGGSVQQNWLKMYRKELDRERHPQPPRGVTERPILQLPGKRLNEPDKAKILQVFDVAPTGLAVPASGAIAIALQVSGARAISLLETESGKHLFEHSAARVVVCHVEAVPVPLIAYEPPPDIGRQGAYRDQTIRRTYQLFTGSCLDLLAKQTYTFHKDRLDLTIAAAAEDYLANRTWALLEQWN